jgi:hypothetical protein
LDERSARRKAATYTQDSTNTEKRTHTPNIHALSGIRNHDSGFGASEDSACLRPLGYRDRPMYILIFIKL